jgi:hypothetical protein
VTVHYKVSNFWIHGVEHVCMCACSVGIDEPCVL